MKKIIIFLRSFLFITNVKAESLNASIINCESYDNLWMEISENVERVKLIAFDIDNGELDNEINSFICNTLKSAKKIEVEKDLLSTEADEYNRYSYWVYVDDVLLQKYLIEKGYGQVNNVFNDYAYVSSLCDTQRTAIQNGLGIWKYADIKEAYCNSGITINNKQEKEEKEDKKDTTKYDFLWRLISINGGIVVLLLILRMKK